ncbi:hypothetical protein, partial [Methylosinus sp. R-45379]|uniref:hypothetical protein n=1 Tax=Methylosinus sp. R-45379 TaxID=980563 RepID=UPI000B2970D0
SILLFAFVAASSANASVCNTTTAPGGFIYQTNNWYQRSTTTAGTLSGTVYYVSWSWPNYTPWTPTLQLKICLNSTCGIVSGSQAPGSDTVVWAGITGNPTVTVYVQNASNPTRALNPAISGSGNFSVSVCSQ